MRLNPAEIFQKLTFIFAPDETVKQEELTTISQGCEALNGQRGELKGIKVQIGGEEGYPNGHYRRGARVVAVGRATYSRESLLRFCG